MLRIILLCLVLTASMGMVPQTVLAQSPQDTLNQYVAGLQSNPNDTALREKIIKHAQTMSPSPAVPEEARRHYVRGSTFFDDAKQASESAEAAEELRRALLIAPWWGEAYMKLGLALESAQRYDEAIVALKLFMATKPPEDVMRKAQDEIYKIEARAQKAVKASSPEAIAAKKQKEFDEWLKKLNGARYKYSFFDPDSRTTISWTIVIENNFLVELGPGGYEWTRCEIGSREFSNCNQYTNDRFIISENGGTIVHEKTNVTMTYYRQ